MKPILFAFLAFLFFVGCTSPKKNIGTGNEWIFGFNGKEFDWEVKAW